MRRVALTGGVLTVIGTRPEAIKMAPVLAALQDLPVRSELCVTGQHPRLLGATLAALGLTPDHRLPPFEGADLIALMSHVLTGIAPILDRIAPDLVVVHGDTTSTLAGALAAAYRGIDVAHVEAGLRTGDPLAPFPEELNRRVVDGLSRIHLAPTRGARDNLIAEGLPEAGLHITGNPVVDAVQQALPDVRRRRFQAVDRALGQRAERRFALVTCHRREIQGDLLEGICHAVARLAAEVLVLWPVHPSRTVAPTVHRILADHPRVVLLDPLAPGPFLEVLDAAAVVLTDSGGVQEEAALLGRPTLVLRDRTERPEVLQTGVVRVIGADPAQVVEATRAWLVDPPRPHPGRQPLGDGRSGPRIARILAAAVAR